ncbi:MAG: acyl carrier protein [Actinobacteria bacterium 13_1_20CM_3_71_11]|nr:MAG: acyl carrier protein [Actinobacteria bacterium 13_1_20CM_3_71_11]
MERSEVTEAVKQAVVDALGLEADEVTPDATLLDDLGAESIDLLDILFRLERSIKIKIQAAQLAEYVQGGIPDDQFGDADEVITEVGLTQLKKVMPQIDMDALRGKLAARQVMSLFTVDNLVDLVMYRISVDAVPTSA